MIIKGADIIGLKILAVKEDKEIGSVKDLIYDPKKNQVTALIVSIGDILTEAQVLPLKEVQEVNDKTVLAKSIKSIKPASEVIKPMSNEDNSDSYMKGTQIETNNKGKIGNFNDIFFDTKTGKVEEFEIKQSNQTQKLPVKEVITSSPDTTVIKAKQQDQQEGLMGKISQFLGSK